MEKRKKKMRIIIQNFRVYRDKVIFDFPEGRISLISAESGKGKSTICQAIYWCLYGGMQHIYPKGCEDDDKRKCSVILEFSSFRIERRKPPSIFIVEHNNVIYEDDIATNFIKRMFGSQDLWRS